LRGGSDQLIQQLEGRDGGGKTAIRRESRAQFGACVVVPLLLQEDCRQVVMCRRCTAGFFPLRESLAGILAYGQRGCEIIVGS